MDSSAERVSTGPAESSRIRTLFYLGEAMMVGSLLTIFVTIAFFLVVLLRRATMTELLGVGVMGLVFLVLTIRNGWALREATHESRQPRVYEEWTETRQWRWVITGAILVFWPACPHLRSPVRMGWPSDREVDISSRHLPCLWNSYRRSQHTNHPSTQT